MPANQFTEGMLVIIDKDSRDEVRISQLHVSRLWHRRRIVVLLRLELPHDQLADANQKRDRAQAPTGIAPISCKEKDGNAQTDHDQNNSASQVRASARHSWRS